MFLFLVREGVFPVGIHQLEVFSPQGPDLVVPFLEAYLVVLELRFEVGYLVFERVAFFPKAVHILRGGSQPVPEVLQQRFNPRLFVRRGFHDLRILVLVQLRISYCLSAALNDFSRLPVTFSMTP